MRKMRAKKLRKEFHQVIKDVDIQMYSPEYKKMWRRYKHEYKRYRGWAV